MKEKINKIMSIMETIEYGFKDGNGNNIYELDGKFWNDMNSFYYLLLPEELLEKKCGVCWDQVELERKLFNDSGIPCKTYFIYGNDRNRLPSHTFLVYEDGNSLFWFEHAWEKYRGIYEYDSLEKLFRDVKTKFISFNEGITSNEVYLFEYNIPPVHIKCDDFYKFIETQKEIFID